MEFTFPDLGEGVTEGQIVKWLVKEGDGVKRDQPLLEVETDKAVAEIPSPHEGIVRDIRYKVGETVKVGEILFTLETGDDAGGQKKEEQGIVGNISNDAEEIHIPHGSGKVASQKSSILTTPAVRKLAETLKVALDSLKGTGKSGRITADDVKAYASGGVHEKVRVKKKYDDYGEFDCIPLKGIRKTIADNMYKSLQSTAQVTHSDVADLTEIVAIRKKDKIAAEKKGIHLTYLSYFIKAVIKALEKHPILNSQIDDEDILVKKYVNMSVAVDTDYGLVVPVVKRAHEKSMLDIAKEIQELAQKARARKLDPQDMKDGTFTITNIGAVGGTYFTPILNYPQTGILGIGKIHQAAVVRDGKVAVRDVVYLSITFDHRVVDGARAARFMNDLIHYLEHPSTFLD